MKKKGLEKKFVFQNDAAARYIFFALKNDIGGLDDYQLNFSEFVIHLDTYYDTPDLAFSQQGEIHRYREKRAGGDPVYFRTEKKRILIGDTFKFDKKEDDIDIMDVPETFQVEGKSLPHIVTIRTYRIIIAVHNNQGQQIFQIHCDQSTVLKPDGAVKKRFYEIELQHAKADKELDNMEIFSHLIQEMFNLSPIHKSKIERALDIPSQ